MSLEDDIDGFWDDNQPDYPRLVDYLCRQLTDGVDFYEIHDALNQSKWANSFGTHDSSKKNWDSKISPKMLEAIKKDSVALFEIDKDLFGRRITKSHIQSILRHNARDIFSYLLKTSPDLIKRFLTGEKLSTDMIRNLIDCQTADLLSYLLDKYPKSLFNKNILAWDLLCLLCVCFNIRTISVKKDIWNDKSNGFSGCNWLQEVEVQEGTTIIGAGKFENCRALTNVVIPASVRQIGFAAFSGCSSLKRFVLPEGVGIIRRSAFANSGLTEIILPQSILRIEGNAFANCNLSNVILPENITFIAPNCFSGCSSLSNIAIPNKVTIIDRGAFRDCS